MRLPCSVGSLGSVNVFSFPFLMSMSSSNRMLDSIAAFGIQVDVQAAISNEVLKPLDATDGEASGHD